MPVLTSQAAVESMWRGLMQPLGWRGRSLWFVLVAPDDRALPHVYEIGEVPETIDPGGHAAAAELWHDLLAEILPGGRIALLLTRPGSGGPSLADRELADGTYAACRRGNVPLEVIHLATDHDIVPLPADAVLGPASVAM